MKRVIILVFFIIFSSCKTEKKETIIKEQLIIDETLINGVWAENEDENAIFEINKDTLRYVESYETVYKCLIKNNHLIIKEFNDELISSSVILKVSKDSLILKPEEGSIIRLYKR